MAEYRKQIAYLDYLEDGVKIKKCRICQNRGTKRTQPDGSKS